MRQPGLSVAAAAAVVLTSCVLLAARAWDLAFLCDDAYISFRYVRNLVEGHGLVFNPGEHVEGYTNFLWVLELAALWVLTGAPPEQTAHVLSALATIGTVGGTIWLAARTPLRSRGLVVAASVVLLCTDRNVAVWATSGLETRQFTALVLLGIVALTVPGARAAAAGSALLAGAALTRPEGQLVFAVAAGLRGIDEVLGRFGGSRREQAARVAALAAPFGALVGGHLLWRRGYYGDWVPNTYWAKHVRPWPEMGDIYLLGVTVETALYLVVPLALLGVAVRARRSRRFSAVAGLVAVACHAWFVRDVGGDHFEWRMLDWWWPLLFVGAAEGTVAVAERLGRPARVTAAAAALTAVLVVYGSVLEVAHDRMVTTAFERGGRPALQPTPRRALTPEVWWLGLGPVVPAYDRWMQACVDQGVAIRHWRHREFWQSQVDLYGPYLALRRTLDLPDDAVAKRAAVGVMPYHLPDLVVIDTLGLTDKVVARHRAPPNDERHMAHDRRPPPGYLDERGVNMTIAPHVRRLDRALAFSPAAVALERGYMPFDTTDPAWALRGFGDRLAYRRLGLRPADNRLKLDRRTLRGRELLGAFERGLDGWEAGGAFAWHAARPRVDGHHGDGLLDSYHPEEGDRAVGEARSRAFLIGPDDHLALLVGGGRGEGVGVRLEVDGETVAVWRGHGSERLRYVFRDLAPYAGRVGRVVAFDEETGSWGHVLVDHVVILEPAEARSSRATPGSAPSSRPATFPGDPHSRE